MNYYIPKHFRIEELVPPHMVQQASRAPEQLFILFDVYALQTLEALRHRYGPVTINNWHMGGSRSLSGWRPFDCSTGAPLSQHKFGRAFDCLFRDATPKEVRYDIINRQDDAAFAHINRIEAFEGMNWFHFDTGNHMRNTNGIAIIGGGTQ